MRINKHGLKISGLRRVCGELENYSDSAQYNEVFYSLADGSLWTVYQHSIGHNSWTVYHDESIIKVCETSTHMTMQQLADMVKESVDHHNRWLTMRYIYDKAEEVMA